MIWIPLSIVGLVLAVRLYDKSSGCSILLAIIPTVLLLATSVIGLNTYPYLASQREEVLSLQSEIEAIKNAYYKEANNGALVGGSLDNMQQSTNLSQYIKSYANRKADFNKNLTAAQVRMSMLTLWWVGEAMYIDKRVLEIEPIE